MTRRAHSTRTAEKRVALLEIALPRSAKHTCRRNVLDHTSRLSLRGVLDVA